MPEISPVMLNDTLNLIQLARETARIQGQKDQAERLTPVVDNLRSIVSEAREAKPAAPNGVLAQDDFKTLLNTVQSRPSPVFTPAAASTSTASFTDRTQMVMMMSAGGMSDLEIARQMGMTRDEIQLITSINRRTPGMEYIK